MAPCPSHASARCGFGSHMASKPLQPHEGQVSFAPEVKRPKVFQGVTEKTGNLGFPSPGLDPFVSPHSTKSQNHRMLRG